MLNYNMEISSTMNQESVTDSETVKLTSEHKAKAASPSSCMIAAKGFGGCSESGPSWSICKLLAVSEHCVF